MPEQKKPEELNVQAANNSIAVGSISAGGDINGNITIGNTGYTVEEVSVLIRQIQSTLQPKPFDGRCPYKGLDVFEEEDAELFFGREKLVDDLVSRVKDSRAVFVTGSSGSGKSSLVRAGLIHALKQGKIKNSERWLYATMKPGRDPIGELGRVASSLAGTTNAEDETRTKAMMDATIFARWCEIALKEGRDKRLVLFIDQFEEVFTQISKEEERVAFLNLLTHAATVESGRVVILFSMRSDFVSNCATYPQLNALLNQQFVQIGAMQPGELVSAIAQPALRVGLRIDLDLIAQIINEMKGEPGALPLMQFALKDLFDSQQEKSGVPALILNEYLQRGGIHKALERHADDSFSKLSNHEQGLARSIFSGLIEIGRGTQDTRRTALFDELIPANTNAVDVEVIVQKLADARLVTTDELAGKDTVTISHEKLIDAWPWLKKLVNENRDVIALQNEIASDAKEWEEHKRDNSYLYSGARLATAQEKIRNLALNKNAQAYLKAGIKFEENAHLQSERIRRRTITGLISFSAVVLGLLIFSLIQLNISRAQQLGFQSQVAFAEQNYNSALLYAYQSNLIHKNDSANLVLSQIVYKNFAVGKQLSEYTYNVSSVAWSRNGILASGSLDGTVTIWDLKIGQPALVLKGHTAAITSVAWSAEGQLASGSRDQSVIIWDLKTGQPAVTLKGHAGTITSIAWSADGQLASSSADGSLTIWDLKTGQPAVTLEGHKAGITSIAWSADGRLASSSADGSLTIWDLKIAQPAVTLEGHITSIAWSADGQLVSGSADGTVTVWELITMQPALTLKVHTAAITSIAWSADGQLASGSMDKSVIIWDLKTRQPALTLKENIGYFTQVAWSATGQLVSSSQNYPGVLVGVAESPDLPVLGTEDGTMIIWDLKTRLPAQTLKRSSYVSSVAWSAHGQLAAGSDDGTVSIWNINRTGQPTLNLRGHTAAITTIAWSADGQLIASGSVDGTIIVWDVKTGQSTLNLKGHKDSITCVTWSPNGQLASGSVDDTVIIWDLKTGQPAKTLKGPSYVFSVAWSANGQLASGTVDGTVIVWDIKTDLPAQTLIGHTDAITGIAWSADGRLLASVSRDKSVIVWDLKTSHPSQILKRSSYASSVAWSANGQLASGSGDGTVIIWNLNKTGQPTLTLKGHKAAITSIAWSADGQLLASSSEDGAIELVRAYLVDNPCSNIIRNMTVQEWLDYQGMVYVYQPACPKLDDHKLELDPVINTIESLSNTFNDSISVRAISPDFEGISKVLLTWKGRIILLALILIALTVIYFIVRAFYKSVVWIWHKARGKRGIQT